MSSACQVDSIRLVFISNCRGSISSRIVSAPAGKKMGYIGNQKKMAAAWQNASRLNRCWRARTYHWQLPVSGAVAADCDAPASAYNCFSEARLGPLVQCSRQATLARQLAPVDPRAILQSSCIQRPESLDRRRRRLTPAVSSDRILRVSSDSDEMRWLHFFF